MKKPHLSLGPTPTSESCVPINDPNYIELAYAECGRYVQLLRDRYAAERGSLPPGTILKVQENSHDFGTYLDVVVEYDIDSPKSVNAALWLERNLPECWPDSE